MVRVYGAVFGDVTDRAARQLGMIYGRRDRPYDPQPLSITDEFQLNTQEAPWWDWTPHGRIVCQDDFEGTLKWSQTGGTVTKASDVGFVTEGLSALKMVTGAVAGNGANAERHLPGPDNETQYLIVAFWWALSAVANTTPRDFYFTILIEDAELAASYMFGVRYHHFQAAAAVREIEFWNSAGAWERASYPGDEHPTAVVYPFWNQWQLAISRSSVAGYKYKNIWVTDRSYFVDGTLGEVGAFALDQHDVVFGCTTDAAAATTAYVDGFTLNTQAQFHV